LCRLTPSATASTQRESSRRSPPTERRQTYDLDLVPQPSQDNYEHLAAALQELNARLRVGGMTDEEARQLPVQVDGRTLRSFGRGRQPTPRQFGMSLQRRPGRRL